MAQQMETFGLDEHIVKGSTRNNVKFVSVFRINGQPIIPPLMTPEKRRQMLKFREKAINLEHRLEERRMKNALADPTQIKLAMQEVMEEESNSSPRSQENSSQSARSEQVFAFNQKADEEACELLVNMMKNNVLNSEAEKEKLMQQVQTEDKEQRLNKLKLSQTLVYDNSTNEIIMPLEEFQEDISKDVAERVTINDNAKAMFLDAEVPANVNNNNTCQNKTNNSGDTQNGDKSVPLIYINPPTPMIDECSISEALQYAESLDIMEALQTGNTTEDSGSESSTQARIKAVYDGGASNESIYMRRSATSPALKQLTKCLSTVKLPLNTQPNSDFVSITRSNSFTVDSPSKALIEHMKQQELSKPTTQIVNSTVQPQLQSYRAKPSGATRDTVESRAKRVTKSDSKQKIKAATSKKANNSLPSLHQKLFKIKRSPYESRQSKTTQGVEKVNNSKNIKKKLSNLSLTTPTNQQKTKTAATTVVNKGTSRTEAENNQNNVLTTVAKQVLDDIEAAQREKFLKLIGEQAAEQQRLQRAFEAQQQLLLEQLSKEFATAQLKIHRENNEPSIDASSPRSEASNVSTVSLCSSISRNTPNLNEMQTLDAMNMSNCSLSKTGNENICSPRRRLFSMDSHSPNQTGACGDTTYRTSPSCKRLDIKSVQESFHADLKRDAAVATINAYARGFLVRRLFKTEQIQRIVQTIRDTLVLVINLYIETRTNSQEACTNANLRFKVRLLQQLSSAKRTMHLVFFQTTLKERMDIIARDRRRIKTKLLTNNMRRLSPRIPGST